jgi:preprotein translocase subunit SecA
VCLDKRVLEAGGVHVVQTFVSLNKAEEVQIQGRTARQGKDGTYSLVLFEDNLVTEVGG